MFRFWHAFTGLAPVRAWQPCPGISDVDFHCDLTGIVDLDAQIPNGTFDLLWPCNSWTALRFPVRANR
jgi:hypothetical protein